MKLTNDKQFDNVVMTMHHDEMSFNWIKWESYYKYNFESKMKKNYKTEKIQYLTAKQIIDKYNITRQRLNGYVNGQTVKSGNKKYYYAPAFTESVDYIWNKGERLYLAKHMEKFFGF